MDISDVVMMTKADWFIKWSRKSAIWPLTFGIACCAIEMIAAGASRFDGFERFGMLFRASPRQSDLMIVEIGRASCRERV